jgi:hypothetical protein
MRLAERRRPCRPETICLDWFADILFHFFLQRLFVRDLFFISLLLSLSLSLSLATPHFLPTLLPPEFFGFFSLAMSSLFRTVPLTAPLTHQDTVTDIATNIFFLLPCRYVFFVWFRAVSVRQRRVWCVVWCVVVRYYKHKIRHVKEPLLADLVNNRLNVKLLPKIPWDTFIKKEEAKKPAQAAQVGPPTAAAGGSDSSTAAPTASSQMGRLGNASKKRGSRRQQSQIQVRVTRTTLIKVVFPFGCPSPPLLSRPPPWTLCDVDQLSLLRH